MRSIRKAPRCIITAGPNGAGKTTFARQYLTVARGILHSVTADLIASGSAPLHPELAARTAGRLLLMELDRLVGEKASFALGSTLRGRSYLERIARMRKAGYQIEMVFLRLSGPELSIKRVAHRVKQGGHHVPDEDVRRPFTRGRSNFVEHYRSLADPWAVYENSGPTPILLERHP